MAIKPIDMQTNVLQIDNAAKEIQKHKEIDIQKQNVALALQEKQSIEKSKKIEQPTKVESTLEALDNDLNKRNQEKSKQEKKKKQEEQKKETSFFSKDPLKGNLIDIKE